MIRLMIVAIVCVFSLAANSATLVESGGKLMGATGVDVGGTLYDVSFVDGSCDSLFSGCTALTFTTSVDAQTAATALLNQVFNGTYGTNPTNINGVSSNGLTAAIVYTPYEISTSPAGHFNHWADYLYGPPNPTVDKVASGFYSQTYDTASSTIMTFAVWTPTPVPLPAAAWLFGSALLGLGAVTRKKA